MLYQVIAKVSALLILIAALAGCASTTSTVSSLSNLPSWMQDITEYKQQLPAEHPDSLNSLFAVSGDMRQAVNSKFGHLPKDRASEQLAYWLISEDGLNMQYDIAAQLSPIEAYEERRGNCLSFTILLSVLAKELGIDIQYNQVDLPDTWYLNEQNGLLLYRHVNGVYKSNYGKKQIFDLAIENYDFGYPQRIVSKEYIAANLHNNRGIDAFYNGDQEKAFHHIKLAISILPQGSDLWSNLGALLNRIGKTEKAEEAFLLSLSLDDRNGVAASNLEKFYNAQGHTRKAQSYAKIALKARQTNPYYHYHLAQGLYEEEEFSKAQRSIRKAKKLHDKDPRFFELSSLILQRLKKYPKAFKELEKAYALAATQDEKQRYYSKAERVAQLAEQYQPRPKTINTSGLPINFRGY